MTPQTENLKLIINFVFYTPKVAMMQKSNIDKYFVEKKYYNNSLSSGVKRRYTNSKGRTVVKTKLQFH